MGQFHSGFILPGPAIFPAEAAGALAVHDLSKHAAWRDTGNVQRRLVKKNPPDV
jgi:hypothetical protein